MPDNLLLKLFDPGMTHLHRVGLAGLYMTLNQLDPADYQEHGGWKLTDTSVEFFWKENPRDLLEPIIDKAFGISKDGVLDFLVHRNTKLGYMEKMLIHQAIMQSYLQFWQWRKPILDAKSLVFNFGDKSLSHTFKPVTDYKHKSIGKDLFNKTGSFKKNLKLSGCFFPGAAVKHNGFLAASKLTSPVEGFLCLLFAPIGSLYFVVSCKNKDAKFDKRKGSAIVLPHIKNMATYDHCYKNILQSPAVKFYANSLGDAGLSALSALNPLAAPQILREVEIDSCSIVTLGKVQWSKQILRTSLEQIRNINRPRLAFFSFASQKLEHKLVIKEDESYYVQTSTARGLIAGNIAADRPWYTDFYTIMQSKKIAKVTKFDWRELNLMTQDKHTIWPDPADKLFVEAIHAAIRNRYGALAARASAKGEKIRFDREFEKIRTSLMRSKNAQTMRAELADLFARGGINKALQQNWPQLLELFTGKDWQKARDLSLLALASYAGKGADENATDNAKENEE